MTYRLHDDESIDRSNDVSGRYGSHSADSTGDDRYTYQRPADWAPRRRRRYADPDEQPTAEETPVDWWGGSANYAEPSIGGANYAEPIVGGANYTESGFGGRNSDRPSDSAPDTAAGPTWYEQAPPDWNNRRRGDDSAWDADALRAAAGVLFRDRQHVDPDATEVRAPSYGAPAEQRPQESTEPAVPVEPPPPGTGKRPRKHLVLRIAAALVLVFSAAIGVAVTVLRDSDPDTVQVQQDLQADAPLKAQPSSDSGAVSASPTQDSAAVQKQQHEAAVDAAQTRAADKATTVQKKAAQTAERAEKARASRSEARTESSTSSSSGSSSSSSGSKGDPVPSGPADCSSYSGNKKTGCSLLSEFGFATSQMSCLEKLWDRESGWRVSAQNPSSGAFGIPQALPGSKMATVAGDWQTNAATQIRWGLGYIKGRYTTPCGAWGHSESYGWY
ncbi:hypothetical protein [Cryptosporangium sp. NPDC051539]|uniref:aggregation-promoting factor C-terminal-like domain-containing protein n=1 Tax=Cryptosporangium sp. NPDC051539 TaxID=3363962 RepID=UPI0037BE0925